jgi:uncharacterized membrane protein
MGVLSKDLRAMVVTNRSVVLADWIFTTPAVIVQPLTGIWLALEQGWPITTGWILWSVVIYLVAGACWLPVVWIQIRMRRLAEHAAETNGPLPPAYHQLFSVWFALGWPAFVGVLLITIMMVFKPDLWVPTF